MLSRWARLFAEMSVPWRPGGPPPTDRQELGEEARRLLDNPVLHEAMDRVEQTLVETWKRSDPADAQGREAVFAVYLGMQRFRGQLQQMIANAGMAIRQRSEP
jgi:hypothetical protein